MSWGSNFGYSIGPSGEDDYGDSYNGGGFGAGSSNAQFGIGKRSHSPDSGQMFKKPRAFEAAGSWEKSGGNGFANFGPTSWDQLRDEGQNEMEPDVGSSSWDNLSGPTSWDQISSEPKPSRGGGRGIGRGGRGGGTDGWGSKPIGRGGFGLDTSGNFGQAGGSIGGGGKPRGQLGGLQRGMGQRGGGWGQQQSGGQAGSHWGGGFGGGAGGWGGRSAGRGGGGRGRGGPRGQRGGRFQKGRGGPIKGGGNLSLVDKFVKFGHYLRNESGIRVNAIQSIENGCTASGLGLKTEYEEDALPKIYNRPLFTAKLSISGIFLARSMGGNKKNLKHEVYDQAMKILTEKTVSEINDLKDPGMESIKAIVELFLKEDVEGLASQPSNISMEEITAKLKEKMTFVNNLQTGLQKLVHYLKTAPNLPENPISQIEQGIQASKCALPHTFECTEEKSRDGKRKYCGALMFGELCVARAEDDMQKRSCKLETYTKALEALKTKPLSELLVSIPDPSGEEVAESQEEEPAATVTEETTMVKNKPPPKMIEAFEDRLRTFMKILLTTAFQEDNIHNMDNLASHYNLTIMCIFRKASPASDVCSGCELYIENYLIATGVGSTKKECMTEAYSRAWEVLTTSNPEDILNQHKKIAPEESAGPSVLEVFIKGATGLHRESNLFSLRRYGLDPHDETKKAKDLVIVECADWHRDRKNNAFCILQYSATANGMLLQWASQTMKSHYRPNYKFEKRMADKLRLTLYLQSEEIGEAMGIGKNKVRNQAAAHALFTMYETHDVLRVVKKTDEDRWIPFEQIEEECNALRKEAGQPPRKKQIFEGWEAQVDEYLITALKTHISKFFPRDDAEELLFGVGIPDPEIRTIQAYARSLKICCDTRQFNEEPYLVLYLRQDMQKVVSALKAQGGGMYGKYMLVPRDELPSSDSLPQKAKT